MLFSSSMSFYGRKSNPNIGALAHDAMVGRARLRVRELVELLELQESMHDKNRLFVCLFSLSLEDNY